jgi:two-component system, NtrC family, response regulator
MKKLLVIDDELGARESLKEIFHGFCDVLTAENAIEGLGILSKQPVDLIMLDVVMVGMDGMSFLKEVREIYPDTPVLMVSASAAEKHSGQALGLGAIGFVKKPFDVYELRHLVAQTLAASEMPRQREIMEKEMVREFPFFNFVAQSPAFKKTVDEARKISQSDSHVLLAGERGTGKEFLARQIHAWSQRATEPFVAVHCGNVPATFLSAEIFGASHRGAQPDNHHGAFDLAGNGTVFLEELDKLPDEAQAALAKVLHNREFQRGGSEHMVPTTARVIATLDRPLDEVVRLEGLTEELAAAFGSSVIAVPAMRDRREDIPLLAYHFLNQLRPALDATTLDIDPAAMEKLRDYSWPGNIRELRNVIERMLVLFGKQKCLNASALPREFSDFSQTPAPVATDFEQAVSAFERQLIIGALQRTNGVVKTAAEILRTTPRILQYRINKLKIKKMAG